MQLKKRILAIDGDGVLFDYRKAYPGVWRAAFGTEIQLREPNAYHAHTAYGIVWKTSEQEAQFLRHFGDEAWSTMPLMDGAKEACELLVDAGYELVCVSSMNARFGDSRKRNCALHGLPISDVIAVKRVGMENPNLPALARLKPLALVDDLMDNFDGLSPYIHSAFIDYGRFDSPSLTSALVPQSRHGSLLDFARFWLSHQ